MFFSSAPIDQTQRRCGAVLLTGIGLALVALGARLVYINAALGDRLHAIAERQQQGATIIPARRGTIFDASGRIVAVSRQMPDVFVDPTQVHDLDSLADELTPRVNVPAGEIADKIKTRSDSRYVLIAPQVDEITARAVRDVRDRAVGLSERAVRTYPLGASMIHVLGLVGRDGVGLEGIELAYDQHLRGKDGWRGTVHDARRRALRLSSLPPVAPIDGGDLVLTIDAEIQRIAEEALARAIRRFEAESGVALVMSPADGDILGMACWPAYDPAEAATVPAAVRRNRAVTDPTEPGSVFKPFIACGALEGGFVSTTELIDCQMGTYRFGGRRLTDVTPHGMMDLRGIIARSSNIGMATIAVRMGNEVLHDTIRSFGFGEQTGVGFPGEDGGLVHRLDRWNSYSTTSVCIGYEVAVTPLQLITGFAAIINDGVLLKPRLVKRLLGPRGEVVRSFDEPEIVRRVVSSQVARYVANDVLVSVVESAGGSGREARIDGYRVLGKTGTAKLPYADQRGYEPGAYLATFAGASPADDPEVLALVMIRRPRASEGYYGGKVAAPAVREILKGALDYLQVPPDAKVARSGS